MTTEFDKRWEGICRHGDMDERPRLIEEAFAAGMAAASTHEPGCRHDETIDLEDSNARWCTECGAFHDGTVWIHSRRLAHEPCPAPFLEWSADIRTQSMLAEIRAYRDKVTELEQRLAQPPGALRDGGLKDLVLALVPYVENYDCADAAELEAKAHLLRQCSALNEVSEMNESVIDVCDCCGGDGEFDEPAAWVPTTIKCRHCNGEGFVLLAAEPADEFWMEEE